VFEQARAKAICAESDDRIGAAPHFNRTGDEEADTTVVFASPISS
jgi:hypothetical protein